MSLEECCCKNSTYAIETLCQSTDRNLEDPWGALSYPIYQSATFAHPGLGESTGFDYSRMQNPTRQQLEYTVSALEGGLDTMAFSSGMAAITTVMELFHPGDHILVDVDLYGGSVRLFLEINQKNGLSFSVADFSHGGYEDLIQENTKALYLETPTNPMMHVTDLKKLADFAKQHQLLLIVDNTFLSPYFQNPLGLGADIVVHSGTKFLCGHHDTVGGFVVVKDPALDERLRFIYKTTGACLGPFDSWLILRGIRTLAVRMDRAQENAKKLAVFLQQHPHVKQVIYPGLPEHQGYEIMQKQSRGFGAMLTFVVDSKERAEAVLRQVKLIYFAESLGGTETLITYPITQTHADVPTELLERNGITDCTLRLSVGIESAEDLIKDLDAALK